MTALTIGIILGTTRPARFADRAAYWLQRMTAGRHDLAFEVVDLRDYPMPLFEEDVPPLYAPSGHPVVKKWAAKVASLDGFIFVTAEYNRSVPAALKNALDSIYPEFGHKPAAFVGYGGVGAARAIEHLRLICIELQMAPTRTAVHIGLEPFLAVLQQGKALDDFDFLAQGAQTMLDELSWWAKALKPARAA